MNKKETEELKTFSAITLVLLLLVFGTTRVFADDVVLASSPYIYAEDAANGLGNTTISTTDSGNVEISSKQTPDIIYVDTTSGGSTIFSNNDDGSFVIEIDNGINDNSTINSRDLSTNDEENIGDGSKLEDEIYVPDSDDDCPVTAAVPLPTELQEYLWTKCKKATSDYKNYYAFALAVMEHESTFRPSATHKNSNGSIDRGIMQINSSNVSKMKKAGLISSADDLYNAYSCIDCGIYMLNNYISKFGVSESAYYAYNTGRETKGSNKNSRIVMQYMSKWNEVVFG